MTAAATNVIESCKAAEHAKALQRAKDLERRNSELDGVPEVTDMHSPCHIRQLRIRLPSLTSQHSVML